MNSIKAAIIRSIITLTASDFRSPTVGTFAGWLSKTMMRQTNPQSTRALLGRQVWTQEDTIVELGPAEGAGLRLLAKNPPRRVVAMEISADFCRTLRTSVLPEISAASMQVDLYEQDCQRMEFLEDGSVSIIFSMNVVYFLDPLHSYLQEFKRVLKPSGGVLVFGCKFGVLPKDSVVFKNVQSDAIVAAMEKVGFAVHVERVKLPDPSHNYVEIKGILNREPEAMQG